ncbi:MAG: hypothetical protein EXR77_15435 [Myxococcales bacterium]|nr:hypothetical protein [Myxococcales bacterium]
MQPLNRQLIGLALCVAVVTAGCSSTAPAAPTGQSGGDSSRGAGDATVGGDGAATDTGNSDGADAGAAESDGDATKFDASTADQVDVGSEIPSFFKDVAEGSTGDVDYDLLDPADTVDSADTGPVDTGPVGGMGLEVVYAHSSSQLFKLDKGLFSLVGAFQFDKKSGQVTDIALDDDGDLFAVTFNDVFACDKGSASCKWLATLPQSFNGLTFVPKDVLVPGKAALIGIANSGDWNLIEVVGNTAKVTKLGAYGGFSSSGDAFSVEKVGTYATVKAGFGGGDKLVQVNPATGSVIKTIGDCGVSDLWGVAWSSGVLYGFAATGGVYSIDVNTGKASSIAGMLVPNGISWWGAGVSTRAAGG